MRTYLFRFIKMAVFMIKYIIFILLIHKKTYKCSNNIKLHLTCPYNNRITKLLQIAQIHKNTLTQSCKMQSHNQPIRVHINRDWSFQYVKTAFCDWVYKDFRTFKISLLIQILLKIVSYSNNSKGWITLTAMRTWRLSKARCRQSSTCSRSRWGTCPAEWTWVDKKLFTAI